LLNLIDRDQCQTQVTDAADQTVQSGLVWYVAQDNGLDRCVGLINRYIHPFKPGHSVLTEPSVHSEFVIGWFVEFWKSIHRLFPFDWSCFIL